MVISDNQGSYLSICVIQICMGGTIPESYHRQKPEVDLSNFTTITVARGGSEQIPIDVVKPGQILR